jgi:hypothetical protein
MASMPVIVSNYSQQYHGCIIGILNSFHFTGPAAFAAIYGAFFVNGHIEDEIHQDIWGYFLFSAAVGLGVYAASVVLIRPVPRPVTVTETSTLLPSVTSSDPHHSPQLTGFALFRDPNFHLILWPYTLGISVQLAFINNSAVYLKSFGLERYTTVITVLSPLAGGIANFGVGALSDVTLERFPRVTYHVAATCLQIVCLILCLFYLDSIVFFTVTSVNIYIANAVGITLSPTMLCDEYGTRSLSLTLGILWLTLSFVVLIIQAIFGVLYDLYADENNDCYGIQCFFWMLIISIILSFIKLLFDSRLLINQLKQRKECSR